MRGRVVRAVLALPGMVLVVIPAALLLITRSGRWLWGGSPALNWVAALAGFSLIGIGLALIGATARLFAVVGQGTLAPWDAPERLVVVGPYRWVRNPMISGVIFAALGESLLCGSVWVLGWALVVILLNLIYIPLVEEKGLVKRFGANYRLYTHSVPRWIPRLRPWEE
jgi:protein-S-isoprenylcysteine O-methyltransferase Ste14